MAYVYPDDRVAVEACYGSAREIGETGQVEFRFRRPDGKFVWLESTCRRVMHPGSDTVVETHASARDITARKQMEYREQVRAEVLEMIAEGRPMDDILNRVVDAAHRQESQAAAAAVGLIGDRHKHIAPRLPQALTAAIDAKLPEIVARIAQLAAGCPDRRRCLRSPQRSRLERSLRRCSTSRACDTCWAMLINSRHREPSGVFCIYTRDGHGPRRHRRRNAQTRQRIDRRRQRTSPTHRTTDFSGPSRFPDPASQSRLCSTIACNRLWPLPLDPRSPLAVLLIDVDRFKYVNDTYGQPTATNCSASWRHRLQSRLRASDTLARMGGDEFAAILSSLANPTDAEHVAIDLVNEFKKPMDLGGRELAVTITVGAALFPRHGTDSASLLRNADLALYRAKEAGRNTSRVFTPEMGDGVVARLELESALRYALDRNELFLEYQPEVDRHGKIVSVEALIRWQHPTLGPVSPAAFIPLAEETGLILPIGAWVLQESARQFARWRDMGCAPQSMAVNVSALQFAQTDFLSSVESALATCASESPGSKSN